MPAPLRKFVCTMTYQLAADAAPEAAKLLRAELCGRRWHDRVADRPLPNNTVFIQRSAAADATTHDVHDACARDLKGAAEAVARAGLKLGITRAWVHVSGGGSYGLAAGELLSPDGD